MTWHIMFAATDAHKRLFSTIRRTLGVNTHSWPRPAGSRFTYATPRS